MLEKYLLLERTQTSGVQQVQVPTFIFGLKLCRKGTFYFSYPSSAVRVYIALIIPNIAFFMLKATSTDLITMSVRTYLYLMIRIYVRMYYMILSLLRAFCFSEHFDIIICYLSEKIIFY